MRRTGLLGLRPMSRRCARCRVGPSGLRRGAKFGAFERLLLSAAFGEYCAQIAGGIPMSQGEIVRPGDIGIAPSDVARFASGAVSDLDRRRASTSA